MNYFTSCHTCEQGSLNFYKEHDVVVKPLFDKYVIDSEDIGSTDKLKARNNCKGWNKWKLIIR